MSETPRNRRFDVDLDMHYNAAQRAGGNHHYVYWKLERGWDPRNPDMAAIQKRSRQKELWWAADEARRRRGEEIVAAYESQAAQRLGAGR